MGHSLLCLLGLFLLSTVIHGNTEVLAAVKVQHSWSQIFTGETITLRCEIQGGEGKVWKYEWTAPNTNSPPTSSEYRISRVSVSHSGDYRCRGSSDYLLTGWSDAFTLTVSSSKPRATLTAHSSIIPAGGSVTLSCSVEGSAGWKFDWFRRDSVSSKAQLMRGNEANRVISVSQGGLYHCRGGRGDPVYYTEDSSDVTVTETLTVSGADSSSSPVWLIVGLVCGVSLIIILLLLLYRCRRTNSAANEQTLNQDEDQQQVYSSLLHDKPKAKLRADNTAVPVGGSVTLTCSVNPSSSSGWKYYWYRDEKSSEALTTQDAVFHSNGQISVSQEGLYRCRGGRGNPVYYTEDSQSVRIGKTDKPKAKLRADNTAVPVGGSVTLTCSVNPSSSSGWKYYWYRDEKSSEALTTQDAVFHSNGQISVSQEGLYRCRGGRGNPVYYTEDSQSVRIGRTGWSFYWYKAVPDLSEKSSSYELLPDGSGTAQDSYIIHGQTHTAGYVCRAGRGDPEYHTDHSQPKFVWSADVHSAASLTVSPDRVQHFPSDSVSLTCEGNFTEWRVRKFSEKGFFSHCCNCQKLSGSSYKIHSLQEGVTVYWCESGLGEFSNAVNITVRGDFPVYETIRLSGNAGSGGPADEYTNVTSTLELKVIDEKTDFRKWRNDDPDGSSDYDDVNLETGSVSGSGRGRGH
ncbi:unnamed protein product [Oreochromis niloticus]|nr:unnamed protein product [Mustela putorius furo]